MKAYQSGVWLDGTEAFVLHFTDEGRHCVHLKSGITHHQRFEGEGKSFTRMGDVYIDPEKTEENRRDHEATAFYKRIEKELMDSDQFVIFGPAEMKTGLAKAIHENRELSPKLREVKTAEKMSENQMFAWTAEFFKVHAD